MGDTTIEWTSKTWNPTRGCSLVSPGCTNCYAMGQAHRFAGKGKPFEGLTKKRVKLGVVWTGKVRLAPDMLALPLTWKKPQRVFVNSMSDLFHGKLTNEEIAAVFGVMAATRRHTFQILTKRAKRMREWFEWMNSPPFHPLRRLQDQLLTLHDDGRSCSHVPDYILKLTSGRVVWPLPNVHLGVSAEDQPRWDERVPELERTPAAVRFVSYEPALGPIDGKLQMLCAYGGALYVRRERLHWVIVGGESGPRARIFDVAWARSMVEQCAAAGVACFVKQLGAVAIDSDDSLAPLPLKSRKGNDMAEWPSGLRVRQWPGSAT